MSGAFLQNRHKNIQIKILLIITLNYGQQICLVLQGSNHFTGPMLGKPINI